jgi:hypothetical protein
MTEVVISFEPGPDDQPVGWLRTRSGAVIYFTGWLGLIRALEDELHQAPPSGSSGSPAASSS